MYSRLRRVEHAGGLLWLLTMAGIVVMGCKGINPFLSAQFANSLSGLAQGGGGPVVPQQPTTTAPTSSSDVLASVCDLTVENRSIQVTLFNESQHFVRFSMTFVVSAGEGGFVCDEEIDNYINAGYTDALPASGGNSVTIGCDTITLFSGTRLLTLEFGINRGGAETLPANEGGDGETDTDFPSLDLRGRNNATLLLPVPELIVFGTDDPEFECIGIDLCSQRGFVYSISGSGPAVGKSVETSRIQGTVCNKGFGSAPEWRLDKTLQDLNVQPFQYVAGGTIVISILDRADDSPTNNRNQVVWLVTDADDKTIHFEER